MHYDIVNYDISSECHKCMMGPIMEHYGTTLTIPFASKQEVLHCINPNPEILYTKGVNLIMFQGLSAKDLKRFEECLEAMKRPKGKKAAAKEKENSEAANDKKVSTIRITGQYSSLPYMTLRS